MQLRKWPLFHGAFPFVGGMFVSYLFTVPFFKVACVAIPLLIILCVIGFRSAVFFQNDTPRAIGARLIFFVFGYVLFSAHDFRLHASDVGKFCNKEVVFSGEILETKSGVAGKQQFLVETSRCYIGEHFQPCTGKIVVFVQDDHSLFHHGDQLLFSAQLQPVRNRGNPGEFDAEAYYRSKRVQGFVFTSSFAIEKTGHQTTLNTLLIDWRNYLAAQMERHLDGTFLAIAKALVLGDKSELDGETMRVFSTTGSMHVLAVSGLHIGLILLVLQRFLQLFSHWITKRQAILLAIVLIWIYGGITGASPAVMRAVVMFTILSGSQLLGRQYEGLNSLGLSLFVLLAWDPWILFDLGFQLSYMAMLGIFLLYKPIVTCWVPQKKWVRMAWEGTAVGCAATILTTPLILFWFYQFPNYFALANLGVMLFGFLVLVGGMLFLVTVWIPFVVKLVAFLFAFTVIGLVAWVSWVDSLPGAVSGGFHLEWWELLLAYLLIAAWILHLQLKQGKRWWLAVAGFSLILWWTYNRNEVLRSDQWIVFNDNRFVTVFKKDKVLIGVYDAKWNGSWAVPDELAAYARFSGCDLQTFPLYGDVTDVKIDEQTWRFSREKEGMTINCGEKKWFYRSNGIPDLTEDARLMSTRIQLQLYPDRKPEPFVREL